MSSDERHKDVPARERPRKGGIRQRGRVNYSEGPRLTKPAHIGTVSPPELAAESAIYAPMKSPGFIKKIHHKVDDEHHWLTRRKLVVFGVTLILAGVLIGRASCRERV